MTEKTLLYTHPSGGFWTIPGVNYKRRIIGIGTYRLFEQMTPAMNQEQLAEFYEKEKQKGNPYPTDASLLWTICTSAYTLKNTNPQEAEKLKVFLKNSFREYPNTLTRIIYNPSGKDKIVYNYRTSGQYYLDAKVVGPDGGINEIPDKNILEKFLGTSNIKQINEVSQWINNTNMYIWRMNLNPETKDERVARFNALDGRFDLVCDRFPPSKFPAFRVLRVD